MKCHRVKCWSVWAIGKSTIRDITNIIGVCHCKKNNPFCILYLFHWKFLLLHDHEWLISKSLDCDTKHHHVTSTIKSYHKIVKFLICLQLMKKPFPHLVESPTPNTITPFSHLKHFAFLVLRIHKHSCKPLFQPHVTQPHVAPKGYILIKLVN